ncbi:ABC transporter ATP-binding protein [Lacisediminimonas profundi]|uniref:ABC transporter ATP-binding protein n=1 Tax=Lacisediminimonas profundi TaxID=2603856 RepID=UPI00124BA37D|nr:ABC transporter ATP-binding protein [Lacisediminimonas profundi]
MGEKEIIRVEHLDKTYQTRAGPFPVLKDVSMNVLQGEFVAIMGPSGSGKSTFMNVLGCLDPPTAGLYALDGRNVGELSSDERAALRNRTIGFVFQGFNLLSRMNLLDNVALPLVYAGVTRAERRARAHEVLQRVGLADHAQSLPSEISGGEQQRVAIARALVTHPRLILADEPTGNLDSKTGAGIMTLFEELHREQITILVVTHDAGVAAHALRLVRFLDGRIVEDKRTRQEQPA